MCIRDRPNIPLSGSTRVDPGSRIELKYRIHYYYQYLQIKNYLAAYMTRDHYTLIYPGQGYLVRSLYFDTYDYQAYHEKMAGDNERTKFRIRSYTPRIKPGCPIRVELKMRQGEHMIKRSSFVGFDEYDHFVSTRHWPPTTDPVLIEFERQLQQRSLLPQVLVQYQREGFESKAGSDLRVTFDHQVKSAHVSSLNEDDCFFRTHLPGTVIMEIKFKTNFPDWLSRLVRLYGLRVMANSKFTQAIQVARHDLYHPGGVVVLR